MGFSLGSRRKGARGAGGAAVDPVDAAADGARAAEANPVIVPSKTKAPWSPPSPLVPTSTSSPRALARSASSLLPWRKSKKNRRQSRDPDVSEAEARAVLASKRQAPPLEIRFPTSNPNHSSNHNADNNNYYNNKGSPYNVVPATPPSQQQLAASRRVGGGEDIPIHALPIVMTDRELNPCFDGDGDEDSTTNPSCTDLDLSSTTEEGFETGGGPVEEGAPAGRAGTPVVWEEEEEDNPVIPKVPIVHVKVTAPPQRTKSARRSQSPLRKSVTPRGSSSTPTTPLPPSGASKQAPTATPAVVTPPNPKAKADRHVPTPPPPQHRSPRAPGNDLPDRDSVPLPFDQPERFMELTHAVRRMLVATCEQDNDDPNDSGGGAPTPAVKNGHPRRSSRGPEPGRGTPAAGAAGAGPGDAAFGFNRFQGYAPAYWNAPCGGAEAYQPADANGAAAAVAPPAAGAPLCHPVFANGGWQAAAAPSPPSASASRISPAATASLLCRPPPMIASWTCGAAMRPDGRPCVTGVLSVDDMENDSLVEEEDRHQPKPAARPAVAANDEIQDPAEEEERAARSRTKGPEPAAAPAAKGAVVPPEPDLKGVEVALTVSNVASALSEEDAAPMEGESQPLSSALRTAKPASDAPPDDLPDDERMAAATATTTTTTPRTPPSLLAKPRSRLQLGSRATTTRASSAPPSPGRVRFDDRPQQVRYVDDDDEDQHTANCASLVENSVTDPSDDYDDDDDLYDDGDDDDDDDLYDDESMDSAEYVEFLRHRKERRCDDCSAAEQSGCSEHYAEYQKHRRKRRLDRGLKGQGCGGGKSGGGNGDGCNGEFSLSQELSDLFNDCTYLFRFFNDQYLGIGGGGAGGGTDGKRRRGRRRRRRSSSLQRSTLSSTETNGEEETSKAVTVKVHHATSKEDGTIKQPAAVVA